MSGIERVIIKPPSCECIGRPLGRTGAFIWRKGEGAMWVSVMVAMAAGSRDYNRYSSFYHKDETVALPASTQYFYPMMGVLLVVYYRPAGAT